MNVVWFILIIIAIIVVIIFLVSKIFDGVFGFLDILRTNENEEFAIIDPIPMPGTPFLKESEIKKLYPNGQPGTLNYHEYDEETKQMMMKYLRRKGYGDYMHWNNWIKVEWYTDRTKQYEKMGSSLISCYESEKKKETKHK